jgi:GTP cyclohydrolase I
MKDIQSERDTRNIPINKVGVKKVKYPITIFDKVKKFQQTVASINMYVNLPHEDKGTHMSRFIEILHEIRHKVSTQTLSAILNQMKEQLKAQSAQIELIFPYFIEKKAPISRAVGLMDYNCSFIASCDSESEIDIIMEVNVPITSVCPCSKEISDYGAHNQRGNVKLRVRFVKLVWLEDMISLVEKSASSEVFSILKRVDEKEVTERGYQNPKFVEDIIRDIVQKLDSNRKITWYEVEVENFESIHNHNAYAYIVRDKKIT